jgi:hypothetical protein
VGFPNIPNPQTTLPVTPFVVYKGSFAPAISGIAGRSLSRIPFPSSRRSRSVRHTRFMFQRPVPTATTSPASGLRASAVPIATYTGWGLRAGNKLDPVPIVDGCDSTGQFIPFPNTKAQRMATGDPRPSLQERYGNSTGTNADYLANVKAAASSRKRSATSACAVSGLVQGRRDLHRAGSVGHHFRQSLRPRLKMGGPGTPLCPSGGRASPDSVFLILAHGLIMIGCLPDLIKAQTRSA